MSRPSLYICRKCDGGGELARRVKKLRKARGLKQAFDVEPVKCLKLCELACVLVLKGKKRSSYWRVRVHPKNDVERVVDAAVAYASLAPGAELPERELPGSPEE
jgi:predicted metal-binding protein